MSPEQFSLLAPRRNKAWATWSTARSTTSTCLQHSSGCMLDLLWTWRTCGASWAVAPTTVAWWLAPSSSQSWVCSPSLSVRPATLSGREVTSSRTMSPRATRFSARWMSAFLRWWRPWGLASRRLAAPSCSLPTSLLMIPKRWLPEASTSCLSSVLCLRTVLFWWMAMLQVELQWPAAGATSPSSSCTTTVQATVQWPALRPSVVTLPSCTPRSLVSSVLPASTSAPWASARWKVMPLTRTLPTCCRMTRQMVLTTVRSGRAWRRPPLSSLVEWTPCACQPSLRTWDTPTWSWLLVVALSATRTAPRLVPSLAVRVRKPGSSGRPASSATSAWAMVWSSMPRPMRRSRVLSWPSRRMLTRSTLAGRRSWATLVSPPCRLHPLTGPSVLPLLPLLVPAWPQPRRTMWLLARLWISPADMLTSPWMRTPWSGTVHVSVNFVFRFGAE